MAGAAEQDRLREVASELAAALAEGSQIVETATFRVHVWPSPDPFYRNVAIPLVEAADWAPHIATLQAVFARVDRVPRLEFFAELWPGLQSALKAAGFVVHLEAPLMIRARRPSAEAAAPEPPAMVSRFFISRRKRIAAGAVPVPIRGLAADDPAWLLELALAEAAKAFGEPPPADMVLEVGTLRRRLASGLIRGAVWLEGGIVLGGASLVGRGRVAELAGVWTAPARRRRGIATHLCRSLVAPFLVHPGSTIWLTAGSAATLPLYLSLGFARIGTQLDMALPPALLVA